MAGEYIDFGLIQNQFPSNNPPSPVTDTTAPAASQQTPGRTISNIGLIAQATGSFMSMVGSYYSAEAQKQTLEGQALSAEFQGFMSQLNARQAEENAQAILRAGRGEIGRLTLAAGQEKARKKVSAAARGVDVGVGSASEVLASEDIVKEIDAMTINRNTVRAAGQARMQRVNESNRSLLSGVSAGNLRRTGRSINSGLAAHNAAVAGFGQFAGSYARRI